MPQLLVGLGVAIDGPGDPRPQGLVGFLPWPAHRHLHRVHGFTELLGASA